MTDIRRFEDRGRFRNEWLNANCHFSFSGYHDPRRMGEGARRVWNDDTIQPPTGFPPHGHKSMEIITYVRTGVITHKDSLVNQGRTEAGDLLQDGAGIRDMGAGRHVLCCGRVRDSGRACFDPIGS